MMRRTLGRTGLQVSVLGFGAAEIGYGNARPSLVSRLLGDAIDAGLNVIDTAACYATSEELIGQALGPRRQEVHIFTKCGHSAGLNDPDWSPRLVPESLERSLRRLRTDHVDLLLIHTCPEEVLRRGDLVEALRKERDAGKVRFLGYSGDGAAGRWAVASGAFDVLETSVNIADQEALEALVPEADAAGLGVVAKRSLANVAWRHRRRPAHPYHVVYWERLRRLAYPFLDGHLTDAVRVALGFVLGTASVHTALVGTANPRRYRQNAELLGRSGTREDLREEIRHRWKEVAGPDWTGQS